MFSVPLLVPLPTRSYHPGMSPISETCRYIVRSAGVRSGNPIVQGTRIAAHDVIVLLQNGETVDTLRANCFPQLTRAQGPLIQARLEMPPNSALA